MTDPISRKSYEIVNLSVGFPCGDFITAMTLALGGYIAIFFDEADWEKVTRIVARNALDIASNSNREAVAKVRADQTAAADATRN